ncbi:MAG TPA: DUF4129 domain-containing protein [Thermoanaerobaculia bacterium]|nr:DUF4129 domain-containing protein [Thermoanaerobaculia bacterium]
MLLLATGAQAMPVTEYVGRLELIDSMLAQNGLPPAKVEARDLLGKEITWSRGKFTADASVLQPIIDATHAEGPHRARLMVTIVELRRVSGMESARGDRKLLERIAAEQEAPELPKGGAIPTKLEADAPLLERVAEAFAEMIEWLREWLRKLLEWLLDLLPRRRLNESGASLATRWIVFGVVALILLLLLMLAVNVLRRSRAVTATVETSTPLGSKADEDPLSRGASEWERYAGELARAGRYREAIRAWYHAVLVTSYAAGILHFRKGRTNWEYVASLAPTVEWRGEMIELTRRFEREWYGSEQSTQEALDECGERAAGIIGTLRGAT